MVRILAHARPLAHGEPNGPAACLFPSRSRRAADRQQRDDEHDHGPPRDCERAVVPGEDVPHAASLRPASYAAVMNPVKKLMSWWRGPTDPETLAREAEDQRLQEDQQTIR